MNSRADDSYIRFLGNTLGTIEFRPQSFSKEVFSGIEEAAFKKLSTFEKHQKISRILFEEIRNSPKETFLLPKVVSFITKVRTYLSTYHFSSFEFWLGNYSGVSEEEKQRVRAKIVGKDLPRMAYQNVLPVGTGVTYPGPHFSFAHFSPDVDTTVASFACFLAAFGCKVAERRHHWVVPGGPPKGSSEIDFIFKDALGEEVFSALASQEKKLLISSLDLLTQENMEQKKLSDPSYNIDHNGGPKATLLVDQEGCYIGDWRDIDKELIRPLIGRFHAMMDYHRHQFTMGLISLFAKKLLNERDVSLFIESTLSRRLSECTAAREFTGKQREAIDLFLKDVIGVSAGYGATFEELIDALEGKFGYEAFRKALLDLPKQIGSALDAKSDREAIFTILEKLITLQNEAYASSMHYLDTLEVALAIKENIFGIKESYLNHLADLDQIVQEMKEFRYMTVNYAEGGKLYPLGVIHTEDVKQKVIATASWNDFSNPNETDIRPEVDVISVIDHHKSQMKTSKPITGVLLDAQSSNSILAKLTFEMNDRYSLGGMTESTIDSEIKALRDHMNTPSKMRIMQKLLERKRAALSRGSFYVSYEKEVLEYMQFLFAILDDTDLLTKVTEYDLHVVLSLVNRLKSLMMHRETEVVDFDDLSREDPKFLEQASKKLLQTEDLYSLYGMLYKKKEDNLSHVISLTVKGEETPFFQDTKMLSNQSVVVSQFKHFINNEPILRNALSSIRAIWIDRCLRVHKETPTASLYLLMLSTVPSAEEVFAAHPRVPTYKDELWFYPIEGNKKAFHLLRSFLREFMRTPNMMAQDLEVVFYGKSKEYEALFKEIMPKSYTEEHAHFAHPMVVIKVAQQSVKSRKQDIAPHFS